MRGIITIVLLFMAAVVLAADTSTYNFAFKTDSRDKYITADNRPMVYIGEASNWTLSATWEPWSENSAIRLIHSVIQYKEPKKTDINQIAFQRIYSYGFIDCRLNQLFILNEYYTTQQDLIVLHNKFQPGEYAVDMEASKILQTFLFYTCKAESV